MNIALASSIQGLDAILFELRHGKENIFSIRLSIEGTHILLVVAVTELNVFVKT